MRSPARAAAGMRARRGRRGPRPDRRRSGPGAEHAGVHGDPPAGEQPAARDRRGRCVPGRVRVVAAAARAHHVGLAGAEGGEEARNVLGEILEVGVHDDDVFAEGVPEASLHGGVLADVVAELEQPARLVAPAIEDQIAAAVGALVVDEHVLGAWWARGLEPVEQLVEGRSGPVQGQDHGDGGGRLTRRPPGLASASMAASITWIRASRASRSERTASSVRRDKPVELVTDRAEHARGELNGRVGHEGVAHHRERATGAHDLAHQQPGREGMTALGVGEAAEAVRRRGQRLDEPLDSPVGEGGEDRGVARSRARSSSPTKARQMPSWASEAARATACGGLDHDPDTDPAHGPRSGPAPRRLMSHHRHQHLVGAEVDRAPPRPRCPGRPR